jgi:hypothetical protein
MTLRLHSDASGLCHYLDLKPVRSGDTLEVLVNDKWRPVRYDWSGLPENDPYGVIDGIETVSLKSDTRVRWPQE